MYELSKQDLCDGKKFRSLGFCEQCVYGKHKKVSFKPAINNTKGILDYIHSDLWGSLKKPSLSGCNYLVTFIDEFSRKFGVSSLNSKMKYLMFSENGRK